MKNIVPDAVFWFRRDLRLEDNHGLYSALTRHHHVLPLFIFDIHILQDLNDPQDKRVQFLYQELQALNHQLKRYSSAIHVFYGDPTDIFSRLQSTYDFKKVYANEDYEPYAIARDKKVERVLAGKGIELILMKDHVLCRPGEVLKPNLSPYTIYTPYMKKWKEKLDQMEVKLFPSELHLDHLVSAPAPHQLSLKDIGFIASSVQYPPRSISSSVFEHYSETRNFPAIPAGTSHLGLHLRFGTISLRKLYQEVKEFETTFLNELIWREFFIQILYFFPQVVHSSFKPAYENIHWRNDPSEFNAWCKGQTGYALVDAGMRELNATGFMHNRVRMVTASFLCKHLLIDWRWGEAYFAEKLLDYELASNNGNWQWAAGTGCDAAPYFRIFNPHEQLRKFDSGMQYVLKWAPEYGEIVQPAFIVDHVEARERALKTYALALKSN